MPAQLRNAAGLTHEIHMPLVDLAHATRESKQRLYQRRHLPEVKAGKKAVVDRHASRLTPTARARKSVGTTDAQQLGFDF